MPLPVLHIPRAAGDEDLLRLFLRTDRFWADAVAEGTQLECGFALTNRELPKAWDSNRVIELALPPGTSPADAVHEVEAHYAAGLRCWKWELNSSRPAEQTQPLAEHFRSLGWRESPDLVMSLATPPHLMPLPTPPSDLMILPARAAFAKARKLADEVAAQWSEPQIAEARMLHLDDPHCDALLALRDGHAVGSITVLAVGDIGRIEQVYVANAHRRRGIGRLLMQRALEICARSMFRHVLLRLREDNSAAMALYELMGFRKVGVIQSFIVPEAF
jgi:ribosomal-protein-alanine N-acetyltransferase